jgi:hypothetical protein
MPFLRHPAIQTVKPWRQALLLWLLLLASGSAWATHIVGGELDMQYLQNDEYRLSLNLYFDVVHGSRGAFDNDLTASIFEKGSNRWIRNIVLPLSSNTFVNYTNPACTYDSLITRKLVYSQDLTLRADTYTNPEGYYVAVERCCRNRTIANIVRPEDAAQTFYLEFPAVVRNGMTFRDSTPRTFPPLGDYACLNELFYYNSGGQDADGDSLVYDMVTPLNGYSNPLTPKPARARSAPYPPITWLPQPAPLAQLSADNQIPGKPSLSIGAKSGLLTVRPTMLGLFVFGVRCQEYRHGQKIGETRRDFQILVLQCPKNEAPSLVLSSDAPGARPYDARRDTLRITATNRCLRLRFTDPDPRSRLTATLQPVNFSGILPAFSTISSGTVRAAGQPDTLTASLCFPACLDTKGKVFLLDVVVADDGCSLPKRDTIRVAFMAQPVPNSPPTCTSTAGPTLPLHVRVGDIVRFDVTATDPDADPLTLVMSGRGFAPAELGARLSQAHAGNQIQGQFEWKVDCPAVAPAGTEAVAREFVFTASSMPCADLQAAVIVVPIIVDYRNTPPVLTTTLPPVGSPTALPPLVRVPLGGSYSAALSGTDADRDPLILSATGQGFDLATVGMRFTAVNGPGQASAAFRWDASCDAVRQARTLTVSFQLQETTCQPQPQARTVRFEVVNPDSVAFTPPNIITPNGDALNDYFTFDRSSPENTNNPILPPDFCDARFAEVKIFSRWGQLVYESADRQFRWGGQGIGGNYLYLITFTDGRRFKGWLSVVP